MSDLVDIYTNQIHDNLRPLYANWDLATPRIIGDYGLLDDALFIGVGNVTADFSVSVPTIQDNRQDTRSFASKGNTAFTLTAQGQVPAGGATINAKLDVSFSSEDAMFFNAAGCKYTMAQSKLRLGQDIASLGKKWNSSWVVITDIVDTGAVTAAISSSDSASVTFEADAHVPAINLSDPSLKLSVQSSRNCSFQLAAPQGRNILLGFCGIRGFFHPGFGPIKTLISQPHLSQGSTKTKKVAKPKANPAPSDFFGQIP